MLPVLTGLCRIQEAHWQPTSGCLFPIHLAATKKMKQKICPATGRRCRKCNQGFHDRRVGQPCRNCYGTFDTCSRFGNSICGCQVEICSADTGSGGAGSGSGKDKTKVRAATQRSGKYHWRNRAVNM